MKTVVMEIFEKYGHLLPNVESECLEKEKQQIIEAATHGANFDKSPYSSAHEYYEKTYNNNETKTRN